jgi:fused signal recognition particle receptor
MHGVQDALRRGLAKTRHTLSSALAGLVGGGAGGGVRADQVEEALLLTDLGPRLSTLVAERVASRLTHAAGKGALQDALREELLALLPPGGFAPRARPLHTVLIVGTNGCGKTTTVAKLAAMYREEGSKAMVAAADTFRAAAAEQLQRLSEHACAQVVRQQRGADPSSVVYDCLHAALAKGVDVVLVDTGGRMQTRADLMDELVKIKRVMGKVLEGAPHEILLVLDATTGQNSVSQAEEFHRRLGLTGVVVAKLDGTAKGGAVIAVGDAIGVGVQYVGVGEGVGDLGRFDRSSFVEAMLEEA